jgi:hypothetical protein
MAVIGQLIVTFKPAFHALVECAHAIALEHGDDAASEWAKKALEADWGLFCSTRIESRPQLRLIKGGR